MGFNNFETVKLPEIGTLARGKSKHRPRYDPVLYGGKYPFIQTGDIRKAGKRIKDFEQSYSEVGLSQSKLWKKDTLCITIAANIAETSILDFEACFPDSVVGFIPDTSRCSIDYIYYYFQYFKKEIQSRAYGSVQENINLKVLNDIDIILPPLHIQKKITSILSPLDEKIEVNNKVIQNLEELAQTFFKRWFVDFEFPNENGEPYKSSGGEMMESNLEIIPKGWVTGFLTDIATLIMGQSPKGETYNIESIGLPLLNGASDFKEGQINPLKYTNDPKKVSKKKDFIFGVRATVGNVTFVDKEYALGRGVGAARAIKEEYQEYLYFQLVRGINHLESTVTGSVYINLTKNDIEGIKLVLPPLEIIVKFHGIIENILEMKNELYRENELLKKLRDTLLPKLLSGEIELPNETEVAEHVSIP
ncbi:restriction endonuclease subunit S [Metaplanococcus flavidus]|uniref:Restriction endonuclease subunit S n=1 Tax=Metaplanococcus flavidus TaxID=569883 RepID=A0ABW3LEA6_9BACL